MVKSMLGALEAKLEARFQALETTSTSQAAKLAESDDKVQSSANGKGNVHETLNPKP